MKKIPYTFIMMILVLSLILSGCSRSASQGVETPETSTESEIPFPVGDNANRATEIIGATQTAVVDPEAKGDQAADSSVEPTAEPVVNTPVPTQAPVIVATATPGSPASYVLKQGEHPYCIARRFNVNPNDLIAINGITGSVSPGTSLKIPSNSIWPTNFARSLQAHPASYTVLAGDTIYSIACAFGDVDPEAIIAANSLQSPYTLTAGSTIQIP